MRFENGRRVGPLIHGFRLARGGGAHIDMADCELEQLLQPQSVQERLVRLAGVADDDLRPDFLRPERHHGKNAHERAVHALTVFQIDLNLLKRGLVQLLGKSAERRRTFKGGAPAHFDGVHALSVGDNYFSIRH
ncbi:hypothetical protein SDC9_181857 [bioreactor metagenome]|uniref:Uncharacterized protein n=1 Tax=bioreactor metagenome TaxID=1076179 RepID=A0A645HE37_9ZZZZ